MNFEVKIKNTKGEYELEGVFTSLAEIAKYLDAPKSTVTAIFNAEYHGLDPAYRNMIIDRVYDAPEYIDSLSSETPADDNDYN